MRIKILQKNFSGFTIFEVVVVLLVIAALVLASTRMIEDVDDRRYKETVTELEEIKKALLGDPTKVELGERVDFGYWGANQAWPDISSATNLANALGGFMTTSTAGTNIDLARDSWGVNYTRVSDSTNFQLISLGANKSAGGTGVFQDIYLTIPKHLYEGNSVYIYIHDSRGTLMLPAYDVSGNFIQGGHISRVRLEEDILNTVHEWDDDTSTLTNEGNEFKVLNTIAAGPAIVEVTIAGGTGGTNPYQGNYNWRAELSNDQTTVTQRFTIYPKGNFQDNVLIVKLPGAALRAINE